MTDRRTSSRLLSHLAAGIRANGIGEDAVGEILADLSDNADGRGVVAGVEAAIRAEHLAPAPSDEDVRTATAALLAKITHEQETQRVIRPTSVVNTPVHKLRTRAILSLWHRNRGRWATVGGAIVGALLLALAWQGGTVRVTDKLSESASTYTTGNKQQATITLPDGSTVVLNVASQLKIPTDYATGNRTLTLDGEALFTVQHQQGRPFTVVAGHSTTRVLGTTFIVRHYATDTAVTVAVRDGKVSVASTVVAARQQVQVMSSAISAVQPADPAQFTFASGVLTLNGMPLSEAVTVLGRWYDAEVRLGSLELAAERVNGEFRVGSLADLATILEWMFNARVVRTGNRLILFSR